MSAAKPPRGLDRSDAPATPPRRRRGWPRYSAFGLAGLAVLAVPTAGTAGAGWYYATRVINARAPREYPVEVRALSADRQQVTLTRTDDTGRDIPLALVWPDGHAMLGPVVGAERGLVHRQVTTVTAGELTVGLRAYTSGFLFGGDPRQARGLDFTEVTVDGELGPMPAWLVPPATGSDSRTTWVIAVHGRASTRGEALRVLPTLAALGVPTLAISYRNDDDAPASPDYCYHLGNAESRDVLAAVEYARSQGATDVVLYGWSMGGAAVLAALPSLEPTTVRGVVLDSPVVDWVSTLYRNARERGLPVPMAWAAVRWIERRIGVRLAAMDRREYAQELGVPVLLYVDGDDATVDPGAAREFAAARPELVTLVETAGAGHARSWNLDPAAYEEALAKFLSAALADAPETR